MANFIASEAALGMQPDPPKPLSNFLWVWAYWVVAVSLQLTGLLARRQGAQFQPVPANVTGSDCVYKSFWQATAQEVAQRDQRPLEAPACCLPISRPMKMVLLFMECSLLSVLFQRS
jgi:hypothetical protein